MSVVNEYLLFVLKYEFFYLLDFELFGFFEN